MKIAKPHLIIKFSSVCVCVYVCNQKFRKSRCSRTNQTIKKSNIEFIDYLIIWKPQGLLQQEWAKIGIKEINFFDFFDFLIFWLIMSNYIEGHWKTDKDNRMSGHMTIIPFLFCTNAAMHYKGQRRLRLNVKTTK